MLSQKNISESCGNKIQFPENVETGDFVVGKFRRSEWAKYLPWEEWHHTGIISQTDPLKVVEVSGILLQGKDNKTSKKEIREGVVEYKIQQPRTIILPNGTKNINGNLWLLDDLNEMAWFKPVFPTPIREVNKWYIPWFKRIIISEKEARKRAVEYARKQLGEPYGITATKWNESKWYCSLLIYKSYSRTVSGMYLETYGRANDIKAGPMVTPEDLVDSPRSRIYFLWSRKK